MILRAVKKQRLPIPSRKKIMHHRMTSPAEDLILDLEKEDE